MRNDTMIAAAVALASGYNSFATASMIGRGMSDGGSGGALLPILPIELFVPVAAVFVISTVVTIKWAIDDANPTRENPPHGFKPLTLTRS